MLCEIFTSLFSSGDNSIIFDSLYQRCNVHIAFEVVEVRFPRVLEEKHVLYRPNAEECCERVLLCTLLLVPSRTYLFIIVITIFFKKTVFLQVVT